MFVAYMPLLEDTIPHVSHVWLRLAYDFIEGLVQNYCNCYTK